MEHQTHSTPTDNTQYARHLATSSPLAAAAAQLADTVIATDKRHAAKTREPRIHRFDTTAQALNAANREELTDGDVLVVKAEKVVGFLVIVLPAAITEERGCFGHLPSPAYEFATRNYTKSAHLAEQQAHAIGAPVRHEHKSSR